MHRAIPLLTAAAFLSAGCASRPAPPPRDPRAHLLLAEATFVPTPTPKSVASEAHGSDGLPRTVGWFSVALGAGAGVVALGTSVLMLHQANVRGDNCNSAKLCTQAGLNANVQLEGLAGWNVGAYVVAAAGLGLGTILLLTNPKSEQRTAIEVSPSNSGAALLLRSTF